MYVCERYTYIQLQNKSQSEKPNLQWWCYCVGEKNIIINTWMHLTFIIKTNRKVFSANLDKLHFESLDMSFDAQHTSI